MPISEAALDMLAGLATPSNVRLGREIAEEGDVSVTQKDDATITATVRSDNTSTRTVRLTRTKDGWKGSCSCSGKSVFCKHCVAVLLRVA